MANYAPPLISRIAARPERQRRGYWGRILLWLAISLVLVAALYLFILYPWFSRWGASNQEVAASYVGDELVDSPIMVTTKAVTIRASPDQIWPWLLQLGVDRGGMYSYLWVENWLLRLNVDNSDQIRREWQTLRDGDFIRFTPKEYPLNPGPGLYVMSIRPQQSLVGCFGMENEAADCSKSSTWQFILEPVDSESTRLILRSNTSGPPSMLAKQGAKIGYAFQFYMERKMLNVLKERAEALARTQLGITK